LFTTHVWRVAFTHRCAGQPRDRGDGCARVLGVGLRSAEHVRKFGVGCRGPRFFFVGQHRTVHRLTAHCFLRTARRFLRAMQIFVRKERRVEMQHRGRGGCRQRGGPAWARVAALRAHMG